MTTSLPGSTIKGHAPPKFRTDIQALRGFAVLIVLFYHAKIGPLSAGFLGVDVFFVISGYLITTLVKDGIERGDFSFANFYFRRAKRILPAAYVTFLCTALLAPFFLASSEMNDLRAQMAGSVAFISNIVLWRQSGYFEGEAALKPLLHVWSLSIEEQYYFLLPAFLFFVPRRHWKRGAIVLMLASLALCLYMVHRKPTPTFFLLPTRGWEMALGSIGALLVIRERFERWIKWAFWPALAILLTLPIVKIAPYHPGPDAMLICVATLVVILRKHPLLFRGPVMQGMGWVGDISYSLYLVHWPLFAFLNNVWVGPSNVDSPLSIRMGLLFLSLLLAWVLNRYVEEPTRRVNIKLTRHVLVRTATVSIALVVLPLGISQAVATEKNYAHILRSNRGFSPDCEFLHMFKSTAECRNSEKPEIMVWGDSFAMHLVAGLIGKDEEKSPPIIQATQSTCGPLLGVAPYSDRNGKDWAKKCIDFNYSVVDYLSSNESVQTVVLSSPFIQYLDDDFKNLNWKLLKDNGQGDDYSLAEVGLLEAVNRLKNTIDTVRGLDKKVVIVAPPPSAGFDIGRCLERLDNDLPVLGVEMECQIKHSDWISDRKPVLDFLGVVSKRADVEVVYPSNYLCDSGLCKTYVDGIFIYRDEGHLSYDGSVLLAAKMQLIENIQHLAR
ncbi:acyltransferase family protein [Desulfuromonas sp. TF]|uniref:acyltransferase family protein n=1 Tax=Desulfuromonas sp. TF TaxID=1232410 RepID=UPI0003FF5580|nr:acyltransferase family protein [Desulfuromonas sp. TF]